MSLNKVMVIGHLGRDPESTNLPSGMLVTKFSLATTEKSKDKEHTEWHNIVLFDKQADIASKYLKKGSLAYIEGKIRTEQWDDKQTGEKRQKLVIIGNNITLLDKKKDNSDEHLIAKSNGYKKEKYSSDNLESDVPF